MFDEWEKPVENKTEKVWISNLSIWSGLNPRRNWFLIGVGVVKFVGAYPFILANYACEYWYGENSDSNNVWSK